jgi:hypothetical protein
MKEVFTMATTGSQFFTAVRNRSDNSHLQVHPLGNLNLMMTVRKTRHHIRQKKNLLTVKSLSISYNLISHSMSSFMFYEPLYFEIERLLNDTSLLQQGKAGRNCAARPGGAVTSFKPR